MPVAEQGASSRIASNCRSGSHVSASAAIEIGVEMRPVEILAQSSETTFRRVDRRDAVTGRRELHRLAAGRGAKVEHVVPHRCGISRAGSDAARSCTHQRPSPKPGSSATDALSSADMPRRERHAAVLGRKGLRFRVVGEAEIERRALGDLPPRGRNHVLAPGRAPALLDRLRQGAERRSAAGRAEAMCRARHAPAAAGRRRPAASAVATSGVIGRAEADLLREREAQHHARLAESSGSRWRVALSISASRSGRRRSVSPAIAKASARSRRRQVARGGQRAFERLAAAKHRIEHLQRRAARADAFSAWHWPSRSSSWRHETPEAPRAARAPQPLAARSRSLKPADRRSRPRARSTRLDPTRYGDWEKKGIAVDF